MNVSPAKIRIVPNCKLIKVTSNQSAQTFHNLLSGNSRKLVEKKHHKKFGEILSEYRITNFNDFDNSAPLFLRLFRSLRRQFSITTTTSTFRRTYRNGRYAQ